MGSQPQTVKRMVYFFAVLCISSIHFSSVFCAEDSVKSCLIKGELYHGKSGECKTPLSEGPCEGNEVVVVGKLGGAECRSKLTCDGDLETVVDVDEGAVCGCLAGKLRVGDNCYFPFTPGSCDMGEVVARKSLNLKERGEQIKECPKDFKIRKKDECEPWKKGLKEYNLIERRTRKRSESKDFIWQLIISKSTVCCPPNEDSMLSPLNILGTYTYSSEGHCVLSPCEEGSWPWIIDGTLQCVPADDSLRDVCWKGFTYEEEDDLLVCEDLLNTDQSLFASGRCGRGKVKKNGRCVSVFRGK